VPNKKQSHRPTNKDSKRQSGSNSVKAAGSKSAPEKKASAASEGAGKVSLKQGKAAPVRTTTMSSAQSSPKSQRKSATIADDGVLNAASGPIDYDDSGNGIRTSSRNQARQSPEKSKSKNLKETTVNAKGGGATEGDGPDVVDKNLTDDESLEASNDVRDLDEVASDGDDRALRAGAKDAESSEGREEFEDEDYFDNDEEDDSDQLKMSQPPKQKKDKNPPKEKGGRH